MISFLLRQQSPACQVHLTWMACEMGGKWQYSCCFVGCCFKDFLKTGGSIEKWPYSKCESVLCTRYVIFALFCFFFWGGGYLAGSEPHCPEVGVGFIYECMLCTNNYGIVCTRWELEDRTDYNNNGMQEETAQPWLDDSRLFIKLHPLWTKERFMLLQWYAAVIKHWNAFKWGKML